jgi:hypothetical protein
MTIDYIIVYMIYPRQDNRAWNQAQIEEETIDRVEDLDGHNDRWR